MSFFTIAALYKSTNIMKKYFCLFTLLLSATTILCMNSLSSSKKSVSTPSLIQLRKSLQWAETPSEVERLDPSTTIIEHVDPALRYGTCHSYALSKHLGILGQVHTKLSIIGCGDWYHTYNILENFKKVTKPKPGDIIVYKKSPQDTHITHTGIMCDNNLVESKWGTKKFVCRHKKLNVPYGYGNCVEYHRAHKTNAEIIKTLQGKIYFDVNLMNHRLRITKDLIACARCKKGSLCHYRNDCFKPHDLISYLLEFNLCCSVDTKNKQNKTLLILAARVGNYETVKVLLKYGANAGLKDDDGNTALDITKQKKYTRTINLLTARQ